MDTNLIITLVVGIGGLASAVLAIWALLERVNKKFAESVNTKVKEALQENNVEQSNKFQLMIDASVITQSNKIDILQRDFTEYTVAQDTKQKAFEEIQKHQTQSIIESYKQDIRDIYYKLRQTGIIEDVDKSYVDKIYSHYVALGGNSDISAKYKEICEVYSKRTHEQYDEKAKETKAKRVYNRKPKTETKEE